eukprot:TRINITY_DN2205_c0_g1_i13.p2 TRINITY_DN2205_c0_g1~~TRINITY_DN2205_c0_g1_i13.p2  ORF type:complete len:198 (+),score=40.21 TRINITY_DN2205_c0_g1_i13:431-1024(+)
MRRGYGREDYLGLVQTIRAQIPGIALSTDLISGFCGETEAEHQETLSLLDEVQFERAFMFAYSLREKTHAHRTMSDDVPEGTKKRRLAEVIATFQRHAAHKNRLEVGREHLVLIEGNSKRSEHEFCGRTDTDKTVVVPKTLEDGSALSVGDYAVVRITGATMASLRGVAVRVTSMGEFAAERRGGAQQEQLAAAQAL